MLFDRRAFEDHKALPRAQGRAGRVPRAVGIVLRVSDQTHSWGSSVFMDPDAHMRIWI